MTTSATTMTALFAVLLLSMGLSATAMVSLTELPHQQVQITPAIASAFAGFKRRYSPWYSSAAAEEAALRTFAANHHFVESVNALAATDDAPFGVGVHFALNQWADLTPAEWKAKMLMAGGAPEYLQHQPASQEAVEDVSLPASFDWRQHGAVTGVKNQGSVGSCWAFSTTGNIEGQYFLSKAGPLTSFSEEFLVDCDSNNCGVFGGWPDRAYQYIMQRGGLPTEASYPYCCGTGNCYPCMADKNKTFCGPGPEYCNATQNAQCKSATLVAKLSGWEPISKDENTIAQKLVSTGPLSTLMDASYLQFYKGGIWNPTPGLFGCDSSGQSLDHAVLFVGFGSENSTDYWTIKNSWGATWGEQGFFRIIRGEHKCGINAAVTSSKV